LTSGQAVSLAPAWLGSAFGGKAESTVTPGTYAERNRYRFSTKYLDDEVETVEGTYYYGYRHYLTALGRWDSRDPIKESGGINLYNFLLNGPTGTIDVLGLEPPEFPLPNKPGNNCYAYACNAPFGPKIPGRGNDPFPKGESTCENVVSGLKKDHPEATSPDECGCPEGMHEITAFANGDDDFHFNRQDGDGNWSHKQGGRAPKRVDDPSTYDPDVDGPIKPYQNCGSFCIYN
jgi:RHS repeat-associated protein